MKISRLQLKQIIKEEVRRALSEQVGLPGEAGQATTDPEASGEQAFKSPTALSKIGYVPARAISAFERWFRKKTGIRGVLDPSVIKGADGKLIMPQWASLKRQHPWVAKYPTLFAVAQAGSNVTAGDPIGMLALLAGGGITQKAIAAAPVLAKAVGTGAKAAQVDALLAKQAQALMSRVGNRSVHQAHRFADTAAHHGGTVTGGSTTTATKGG